MLLFPAVESRLLRNLRGKPDLAVVNFNDNSITLFVGNGNGPFIPASGLPYAVGKSSTVIAAADFDNDGTVDLAVAMQDLAAL